MSCPNCGESDNIECVKQSRDSGFSELEEYVCYECDCEWEWTMTKMVTKEGKDKDEEDDEL